MMKVEDNLITVRDLIRTLRNVSGGVHRGDPSQKEPNQEVITELQKQLFVGGAEVGLRSMRAIGRVVLKGLKPFEINDS